MLLYKIINKVFSLLQRHVSQLLTHVVFMGNSVKCKSFHTVGVPFVSVCRKGGEMYIGENFRMNNGVKGNPIGCNQNCQFAVDANCKIIIGNNVGMSQAALVAVGADIIIDDFVKIGGAFVYILQTFIRLTLMYENRMKTWGKEYVNLFISRKMFL